MPPVLVDDVPWVEQYEDHFCGPACAQMILLSKEKVPDDTLLVQTALFNDIKNDTRGGYPMVEQCGTRVVRWESFPRALAKTLNRRMAQQVDAFAVHQDATELQSTARAVRGVNAQLASAALLEDSTHWMVVYGWENRPNPRGVVLPSIVVDGQRITDLYVFDPNWPNQTRIDVEEWVILQYRVDCGAFQNTFVCIAKS
jgi:hypothetical protein